jgi:hypothetical protein
VATHRVLDVGSGVGKFAICAAAAAPGIRFVGVEHRANLLRVARTVRSRLGVPNVRFKLGSATEIGWPQFDGFYLFNPCTENLVEPEDAIDGGVDLSKEQFTYDVLRVETWLQECRPGTVVVTYCGSGTRIPGGFTLVAAEPAGEDWLRLWVKTSDASPGVYFTETDEGIVLHRRSTFG